MARDLIYVVSVFDLFDALVPLFILAVALYLARLDARERRTPRIVWAPPPPQPPIPPARGLQLLPIDDPSNDALDTIPSGGPTDDARTQTLTPEQLDDFHARLAAMKPRIEPED